MTKSGKITFTGSDGESQLAARLDVPAGVVRAYALFAHCFTCGKDIFAASRIAQGLVDEGIAVLRFDFTGLGASEGEFANTNFSSNVGDLIAAADFLRQAHAAPKILIGHSLGGAAVLAAAAGIPEARAVCTIGAPSEPAHVAHLFQDARADIEAAGEAEVLLAGRPFRIQKQFIEDIESRKLADAVATMRQALLILHSPVDQTVGVDNAAAIFMAAKHPKSFVSLDDADHLLSRRADALYAARVIAVWAGRYIGEGEASAEAVPVMAPPGAVVVAEAPAGRLAQTIAVGDRHQLTADEPSSYGGDDTGPTPYDLLLAALGACTSMTVRMYAERKKWPLEHVSVTLRHEKIHAEDCAQCETETGKIDRIEREIAFTGDLDEEQRARLLEIADRCPVHRTLHSEVTVDTRTVI